MGMEPGEEKGPFVPYAPSSVGHQKDELREIGRHIIQVKGIGVFDFRPFEHGRSRVDENRKPFFLGEGKQGIQPSLVGIEMIVGGIEFYPSGPLPDIFFQFQFWMGDQCGIHSAERHINIVSFTEIQHIFVRYQTRGDGTDIGEDDRFGDAAIFEVSGELLRHDQFLVALVKLGLRRFLVVMNPIMPVLLEPDVDVEVDDTHGNRIPDFIEKANAQRPDTIVASAIDIPPVRSYCCERAD